MVELVSPAFRYEFREFCVNLSLRQIDDIFQGGGLKPGVIPTNRFISGERRIRVEEYYSSMDWTSSVDVEKFLIVVGLAISQSYLSTQVKDGVLGLCKQEGWKIDGNRISRAAHKLEEVKDLFITQFPAGMPFGILKPDFAVTSESASQSLKFELKSGIGIIWKNIYPNFNFDKFQIACVIRKETNLTLRKALMAESN